MTRERGGLSTSDGQFLVDGDRKFLLADTVWSALGDATDDEWQYYLRFRAQQGFNAALISVLPILHDRSQQAQPGLAPFDEDLIRRQGQWELMPAFFDRLHQRLAVARQTGITCGLVLMWVNYVPGSWGARRTPGFEMPEDARQRYLAALGKAVGDREALLIVSGDAGFESEVEIGTYAQVADEVRRIWPASTLAFHLAPQAWLPAILDSRADVLIYQSGHHGENPELALTLARHYRASAAGRPVMNAEPCYEAHRYGGGVGRFGQAEVRRRIWESVVGGASAGVTYGAHGLWGWHRGYDAFSSVGFSGTPLDWREALTLPGAESAAACRGIVEAEGLGRVGDPGDTVTVTDTGWGADQVVVGADLQSGVVVVYLPHGGPVTLRREGGFRLRKVIDLQRSCTVPAEWRGSGDCRVVDPVASTSEALVILDLG
jgi:Protein of unknown function (DUF4038)